MTSSVPRPSDIIDYFPEPVPKITGPPTYASLRSVRDVLKANTFSFATTIGGGNHGYLGLLLPHARDDAIVPPPAGQQHAWEDPVFPGTHPNVPQNATGAQTGTIVRHHTEAKRLWQEWRNVHNALKMQLLQAIDPVYMRSLKPPDSGLSNVHIRNILDYLLKAYVQITPRFLADSDKKFQAKWDPNTPFEHLIDQIESCQDYATDGNDPYTDRQILNNAYNLVYKSGLFFDDCKE